MTPIRSFRALITVLTLPTLVAVAGCDSGKKADEAEAADGEAEPAAVDDDETLPEPEPPLDTGPMEATAETGAAEETTEAETGAADGEPAEDEGDGDDEKAADDGDEVKKDPEPKNNGGGSNKKAEQRAQGKELFEKKCKTCHGLDGKGSEKYRKKVPDLPSLVKTKLSQSKVVSVVTNGVPDTKMKAYKSKLSGEEIESVAVYVKSL